MLAELAEIGMNLARALQRRVEAETDPPADKPAPAAGRDPADGFQRLSRAVRLTLALEARMGEALRALIAGEVAAAETRKVDTARRADEAKTWSRRVTRANVCDLVAHAIAAEIEAGEALWDCHEAMEERLADDEAYEDFTERPLRENVERLCADLGLTPDWSLWTDDGWAFPPGALRPAHSVFNQPSPTPTQYWRDRMMAKPPPLE